MSHSMMLRSALAALFGLSVSTAQAFDIDPAGGVYHFLATEGPVVLQPTYDQGGSDPGGPGGGRGSIRITDASSMLSGYLGIAIGPGDEPDRYVQMDNIASIEREVLRSPAYSSAEETRSLTEMMDVIRSSHPGVHLPRSVCVVAPFLGNRNAVVDENFASAIGHGGTTTQSPSSMLPLPDGSFGTGHVIAGINLCLLSADTRAIVLGFWGSEASLMEQLAIEAALRKGVAVFAPIMSSEYSSNESAGFPASYSSVIAIGLVERDGKLAWWSPEDTAVDFMAPAQNPTHRDEPLYPVSTLVPHAMMYAFGYARMLAVDPVRRHPAVYRHAMESTARSLPYWFDRRYSGSGVADFDAATAYVDRASRRVNPIEGFGAKHEWRGADLHLEASWDGGDALVDLYQMDSEHVTTQRNRGAMNLVIRNASPHGARSLRLCNYRRPSECDYAIVAW